MVTAADQQALLTECNEWRTTLRQYRENLNALRNALYTAAAGKTDQNYLKEVEHYHNQFHIQLINVHDMKHHIKHHIQDVEHHPNFGHRIPHIQLKNQLDALISDLDKLNTDFSNFISS